MTFPADPSQLDHVFRDADGHFKEDTPENRKKLKDTADNPDNYLGQDQYGNDWHAQTEADGSQTWVRSRNGVINNGGTNETPRSWDPNTGLNNPN